MDPAHIVRTGGRLALHEIMAGPQQPIHFPVPWAGDPSISFLRPASTIRRRLTDLGFKEAAWIETSERSLAWFRERLAAAAAGGPPQLGIQLLLGPEAPTMLRNVARNIEEARVVVIEAVFERP